MRNVSLPIYIAAFLITAVIFMAGVYVGTLFDQNIMNSLGQNVNTISERLAASEMLYLIEDSPAYCPIFTEELGRIDSDTDRLGTKLTYMEGDKGVVDPELKKSYFMLELKSYLLSKKVKERCGANHSTALYFYSNANCSRCREQGLELTAAKQRLGDGLRVYSFDGDMDSTVVEALKKENSVTTYPTIIVAGRKLASFTPAASIISAIQNPANPNN